MQKTDYVSFLLITLIPSGYFIWTLDMHRAVFTLIVMSILDLITGVIKAGYCGDYKTSIVWEKSIKKLIKLIIAIVSAYFLDVGIGHSGYVFWSFLSGIFVYLCFFFATIEFTSILENLNDMGLDLPNGLIQRIRKNVYNNKCILKNKKNENKS